MDARAGSLWHKTAGASITGEALDHCDATELSTLLAPGRSFTDKFLPVKMRFIVPNWVSNSDNESLNLNIIILRHKTD